MAKGRTQASNKRIILCADGTWLSSNMGQACVPSNVAKIARAISPTGINERDEEIKQITFYHSGLGTGDLPGQRAIYGGLGIGLDNDVCQIYDFIANNYEPGDELFFFGFSRGAFTVRSVAGLVCDIGVLPAVSMSKFPEMWAAYRANTDGDRFDHSEWYRNHREKLHLHPVDIKVVGVWETVGALGMPDWHITHWINKHIFPVNKEFAYHNTRLSKHIKHAFHALAIDEKRATFPPVLWHRTEDNKISVLKQCWFPGTHSNIGGQAELDPTQGDHQEIGDITFAWMADNVSKMLTFQREAIEDRVKHHSRAYNSIKYPNGWGCGPIVDNFEYSGIYWPVGKFFRLLGRKDRTPGYYIKDRYDTSVGETNETFHPCARIRKTKVTSWQPLALAGFSVVEPNGRKVWTWNKPAHEPLLEHVMRPEKKMTVVKDGIYDHKVESLERRLCPRDLLDSLDASNRIGPGEL